jgi:hypothetical protein
MGGTSTCPAILERAGGLSEEKIFGPNALKYLESTTYAVRSRVYPAKILILNNLIAKYCGQRS